MSRIIRNPKGRVAVATQNEFRYNRNFLIKDSQSRMDNLLLQTSTNIFSGFFIRTKLLLSYYHIGTK